MGRFSNTWQLMRASWYLLRQDKEILLFPLISGICCLIVLASFAVPIVSSGAWKPPARDAELSQQIVYYAILFAFYFCNYFVIVFFNSAVIACAFKRMSGGDPTVGYGLHASFSRIHAILGWALVAATVGLILRIIEDRSEKVGQIVAGLLGMAWTLVSYLVVPGMVIDNMGPIEALKDSVRKLKHTWGEQLIGGFSFGLVFFLLALPAIAIGALGFFMGTKAAIVFFLCAAFVYLIILSLIQSTLQSIFQAALYCYAANNEAPAGFDERLLRNSFTRR